MSSWWHDWHPWHGDVPRAIIFRPLLELEKIWKIENRLDGTDEMTRRNLAEQWASERMAVAV